MRNITTGKIEECFEWLENHPNYPADPYTTWAPAARAILRGDEQWRPRRGEMDIEDLDGKVSKLMAQMRERVHGHRREQARRFQEARRRENRRDRDQGNGGCSNWSWRII